MSKIIVKRFSTFHQSRLSLVQGSTSQMLLYSTIGSKLTETAQKFKNRTSLVSKHQNIRLTWEELDWKVTQASKSFIELGLQVGDRVGIYSPTCEEWTIAQLAASRAGLILTTVNPAYQVNDLKYALNKVGIRTLVMPPRLKTSCYLNIIRTISPKIDENTDPLNLKVSELPNLRNIILLDSASLDEVPKFVLTWEDFLSKLSKNEHEVELKKRTEHIKPEHPTNIQFTSGTTGLPKGALLSHFNILNNSYFAGLNIKYTENDKVCVTVPLYHCFGANLGNLACVAFGSTMVYPNSTFDAEKTLQTIESEKTTSLYGVPTMFLEILNKQVLMKKDVSSLRTGIIAGSVCSKFLMDRCINELNLRDLSINYGMTELSPITHATSIYDTIEKKTTTVGTILPHYQSKIVHPETGEVLERGKTGEICTKGYGLMLGYWEDEKNTRESLDSEGYMKTGDFGKIDEDGYLYIEGRKKDTIIRGGENISPKEIEDVIGQYQYVDDVQVVGVKDPRLGDEICAWVKLKPEFVGKIDKKNIQEFLKGKVAHFKIPRYIRFVQSFPMTITGKPQKFVMRDVSNKILETKSEEM